MRGNSGSAEAAMDMLGPLAERLAAEQINAGLLNALARKLENERDPVIPPELLDRFLQQELRHTLLLERSIRGLGGNPAVSSPASRRLNSSAASLQRMVQDSGASLVESLDALLVAELSDRLAWEKLVHLAESHGLGALAWEFRGALLEERDQEAALTEWRDRCAESEERVRRPA